MATWKRLRALEAAARAGDAAARRELARAAREQQTLQATLGAVDRLVAAAPQLSQAYSSAIAEDILSGKEAPGAPKPGEDDILGQIGAFIREPWRAQGEKMARAQAAQMAPQELAKIRPLLREEFGKGVIPGTSREYTPQEKADLALGAVGDVASGKDVMPVPSRMPGTETTTPQQRIRAEVERSRPLSLLDEQQRQAMVAGEMQRFQREAEEQAKEDQLLQAQVAKLAPKVPAASLPKPGEVKAVAGAISAGATQKAQKLQQKLNSTNDKIREKAFGELSQILDEQVNDMTMPNGEPIPDVLRAAAKNEAISQISKSLKLDELNPSEVSTLATTVNAIDQIVELDKMRKEVKWSPGQLQIIEQAFAQGQNLPLSAGEIIKTFNRIENQLNMTAAQRAYFDKAMNLQVQLTNAEYKGTGAISNQEREALMPYLLSPWTDQDQWDAKVTTTLRGIASKFSTMTLAFASTNRFDQKIIDAAQRYSTLFEPSTSSAMALIRRPLPESGTPMSKEEVPASMGASMVGAYTAPIAGVVGLIEGLVKQYWFSGTNKTPATVHPACRWQRATCRWKGQSEIEFNRHGHGDRCFSCCDTGG
jgi:hypothetical protein